MSQDAPPSRGLVAGKYELLRLIGRGGMGSVWEGRHSSLGTHVAIKFIEKEYADNEEARKRFDNEARAAAALQSKHAIQIHDHGVTEDGKPYIVMEMLVGEALDKRLDRQRVLSLQETVHMLQQVCRGLQKAHEHGIIHRDIKPENIFLVRGPDDDEDVAKVLDFGIAKIRNTDQSVSSSTRTGAVLGTPFYMSPEQARGMRDIDHRTDLWSLGVIAFKCTTGRLPFEGESLGDLLVKICTVPIPMPSQYNPQLPPSFDAWFTRALDRDPNRRFGSAQEFSEALAYAAGISVKQRATPAYGPPPNAMTPGQTPMGYAGTGTAPGGITPAPQYYPATTPNPYGTPPQGGMNVTSPPFVAGVPPQGGGGKGLYVFAALAAIVGLGLGGFAVFRHFAEPKDPQPTVSVTSPTHAPDPLTNATVTPLTTLAGGGPTATTPTATTTTTATAPTSTHNTIHKPPGTTTTTAATHTAAPPVTATAPATTQSRPGDFGAGF